MSSSKSTNKRPFSEFEDSEANDATFNEDDVSDNVDKEEQNVTTLLPPREKLEGRNYVPKGKGRRAEYWVHFWEYKENGKLRAECMYCENKTFACDVNINGSKNVKNHWQTCPANPKNKTRGKQKEIAFDHDVEVGQDKMKAWALNIDDARDSLAYMIIVDELPFRHVEKPGFRHFMSVVCPRFHIPSRTTIARDCLQLHAKERTQLKELLRMKCQRISVTTDTWTSIQRINYMCLTGHFIDIEWKLHKMILNFCPIYNHKGKAIAKGVEECLTSWGVDEKLFTITVDNASSNDVACSELRKMMQSKLSCIVNGDYMHMRCVARIINLIVWDGLKKNKKSINKVRYVVRWNSTFDMLEKALKFRDIFWRMDIPTNPQLDQDTITETHDGYDDNQSGGIGEDDLRNSGALLESDWKVVEGLVVFLREFKVLTDAVSGSLWMNSDDGDFRLMAITMQQKFNKYWGDIEKMNVLIYMGTMLDPKVKFVGLKLAFSRIKMYTPFTPHSDDSFTTSSRCTSSQPTIFNLKKDIENQVRSLATDGRYSSSELDRYLNDQIGEHELEMNILTWWKMNAHRYPILAHLARYVLAMPISTVASESAFIARGRHLDSFRSSLTPKMVQALICSQDWLRPRKDKERGVEEKLEEIEQLEKDLESSTLNDGESDLVFIDTDDMMMFKILGAIS
uniref:Transposase n=1 Tax=Chenopodium quinoa TaxID=63459 RepID=A0A803MLD9_CHEQI